MPALVMNGSGSVQHAIDASCPAIVDFINRLTREAIDGFVLEGRPPDFDALAARLREFEQAHRRTCLRCRAFAGEEVDPCAN